MSAAERVRDAAWIHEFIGTGDPIPSMAEIADVTGDTEITDEQREVRDLAANAAEERASAEQAQAGVVGALRFADGSVLFAVWGDPAPEYTTQDPST